MTAGDTEGRKTFSKRHGGQKRERHEEKGSESDSQILKVFRQYSKELDSKHDKYERIVKHSRDITIDSKRIIFSIHALMRSKNVEEDMKKIKESLKAVRENKFKAIAKELVNEDPYQFVRAYMWGIQEFIEAFTFLRYIESGNFCSYEEIVEYLQVKDGDDGDGEKLPLLIPLIDYVMGLEDMSGELMRHCIDSFSAGKVEGGKGSVIFCRRLYAGLLYLSHTPSWREHDKKVTVAKQSLEKMEYAAYASHVRGSETSLPTIPTFDPFPAEG